MQNRMMLYIVRKPKRSTIIANMNITIALSIALFLSALILFFCFAGEKADTDKYPDWITALPDTCWKQTNSRAFPGQTKKKIEIRFGKKFLDDGTLCIFYRPTKSKSTGRNLGYLNITTFTHGKKNIGLPPLKASWNPKDETIIFTEGELSYIFTRTEDWYAATK